MNIKLIGLLTLASALLTNCGGSAAEPGGASTPPAPSHNSFSAATATDLPTCDATHLSELWYVESTSAFQVCKAAGWADISVTGLKATSNKLISAYGTNICTQFVAQGEGCTFQGGQIVRFNDGSVMLTGIMLYTLINTSTVDTDTDYSSVSIVIPPATETGYMVLNRFVARGAGYNRLFFAYDRPTDKVGLIYDSNGNGVLDGADTLVTLLTETSW